MLWLPHDTSEAAWLHDSEARDAGAYARELAERRQDHSPLWLDNPASQKSKSVAAKLTSGAALHNVDGS